jgi:hypothetical protein
VERHVAYIGSLANYVKRLLIISREGAVPNTSGRKDSSEILSRVRGYVTNDNGLWIG